MYETDITVPKLLSTNKVRGKAMILLTPVCHSVHVGISVQGVSVQGEYLSRGGLCLACSLFGGGALFRGLCSGGCLCPGEVESGWYASYWNAFLFLIVSISYYCD